MVSHEHQQSVRKSGHKDGAADGQRGLLFISHANPEDNVAAAWFATQLTLLGYNVWCDVKDAPAGESLFWLKVQNKIEQEAEKFIFILSDTSRDFQRKRGVGKEVQAADNLRRDNFILPIRIEPLNGSLPIQIGTDIYMDGENWLRGLNALCERLEHDNVPKANEPNFEKILSWWPALSARDRLLITQENELVSNILSFESLPPKVHFLRVQSEGNLLSGYARLRKALGTTFGHSPYGDYTISFSRAHDFLELSAGFEIEDAIILPTRDFLSHGHSPLGIAPGTARNILTYLIAFAFEQRCASLGLESKTAGQSPRRIWFPRDGLINGNKFSFAEPGKRKTPVSFVGQISHFRKTYVWHFGVQPAVDLQFHEGVVLNPKAILSLPYNALRGDKPIPIDQKKALKKLGWWNGEWRRKTLGLAAWMAEGTDFIRIPAGYQEIVLSAQPRVFVSDQTYLEKSDSALMAELLEEL